MPKNTGGRRASARSAAFRPGGNSSTNHKPLFDMNVMSLHARKNVNAAAVTAAAVNATKVTKTTNTLILNNKSNTAYIINHRDSVIANDDNPQLSLRRGQTYIFENKSGGLGHPFRIDRVPESSYDYNSGVVVTPSGVGDTTLTLVDDISLKKGDTLTGTGIAEDTEVAEDVFNSKTVKIDTATTASVTSVIFSETDAAFGFTIDGIGVDGNNSAGPTGKLTFNVPADAPDTLYYYCTAHSDAMNGTINIIN